MDRLGKKFRLPGFCRERETRARRAAKAKMAARKQVFLSQTHGFLLTVSTPEVIRLAFISASTPADIRSHRLRTG